MAIVNLTKYGITILVITVTAKLRLCLNMHRLSVKDSSLILDNKY